MLKFACKILSLDAAMEKRVYCICHGFELIFGEITFFFFKKIIILKGKPYVAGNKCKIYVIFKKLKSPPFLFLRGVSFK